MANQPDNQTGPRREDLSEAAKRVMWAGETERPGTGQWLRNKEVGTYICANCGAPLFASDTKFDSGTGWPSFFKPMDNEALAVMEDNSAGMRRLEVKCRTCGAHLGHVFDDLPASAGASPEAKRYCINSVCLDFKKDEK